MMPRGTTYGFWTDPANVERLRELLADPRQFSAARIAGELRISRNAVIGKVKRMGLKLPQAGTSTGGPKTTRARKRPKPRAAPSPAAQGQAGGARSSSHGAACRFDDLSSRPDMTHGPVRFVDAIMKHGRCKFPTGGRDAPAGPDMLVCGAAVAEPRADGMRASYCAHHYGLSVGEGTRSERRAERIMLAEAG